ncbi:MAG: hypothetical protein P9L99_07700 [Candidatus Lernaella stagnicola]|nr:hypothetical protein [Candidatus Lernaella stagnicola]
MTTLTFLGLVAVAVFLILLLFRLFGQSGAEPVASSSYRHTARDIASKHAGMADSSYQEVLNLANIVLEEGEYVLVGCGQRGEIESVLMATNHRVFFFSRRYGASQYHQELFDYAKMHPLSLGQAVIGERIRLLQGDRIAEMTSPGAESWLDSAEDTIKVVNDRIRRARMDQ